MWNQRKIKTQQRRPGGACLTCVPPHTPPPAVARSFPNTARSRPNPPWPGFNDCGGRRAAGAHQFPRERNHPGTHPATRPVSAEPVPLPMPGARSPLPPRPRRAPPWRTSPPRPRARAAEAPRPLPRPLRACASGPLPPRPVPPLRAPRLVWPERRESVRARLGGPEPAPPPPPAPPAADAGRGGRTDGGRVGGREARRPPRCPAPWASRSRRASPSCCRATRWRCCGTGRPTCWASPPSTSPACGMPATRRRAVAAGWSASTGSPCRPSLTATRSPTAATTSPTPTSSVSAGAAAEGSPGARVLPGAPARGRLPAVPGAAAAAAGQGGQRAGIEWGRGSVGSRCRRSRSPWAPAELREPRTAPALGPEPRAGGVRRCPGRPKCPGVWPGIAGQRVRCQACDREDHVLLCNLFCTYLYISAFKSLWTSVVGVFFAETGVVYCRCCVLKVAVIKHWNNFRYLATYWNSKPLVYCCLYCQPRRWKRYLTWAGQWNATCDTEILILSGLYCVF